MNRSEPPGKVIRRLQRRFAQDEDEVRLRADLDELHAVLAAEIGDILTRDQAESVQRAAREAQAATPEGPGLRHHSLVEARRRGIDLDQLRAAQRSARRKFEDLVHAGDGFSPSEINVRALVPPFDWPPAVEPPPATSAVIYPPFEIAWERDTFRQAAGDAWVMEFESYLDTQWGQLGTWMAGRNHDAGDSDWVNLFHLGGFLIPFTMPATSVIYVRAELTCLVCEHSITTSDEWGWSDFIAFTRTGVKFDVLWERDDGEPMSQGFRERFVPGLDARRR